MEKDNRAQCYRVESRTVVPGVPKLNDQGEVIFQKEGYLVIEGTTEQYISNGGERFLRTRDIPPTEFFHDEDRANAFACALHKRVGCTSPDCGWTSRTEMSEDIDDDEVPF